MDNPGGKPFLVPLLITPAILFLFAYLFVRTTLFFSPRLSLLEKFMTSALFLAELFILSHGFAYLVNVLYVWKKGKGGQDSPGAPSLPEEYPPVAVIVSSYKEPLHIIEKTLLCFHNLTYPNKRLYFLDDTRYGLPDEDSLQMGRYRLEINALCAELGINVFRRKWRGAKAGMINDFLDFVEGRQKEGFEFMHMDGTARREQEKYIAIFDADMNPFPDFIEPLVAVLERNPRMAFVQTPQYYTNFESNRIARASGLQQAVFYEYICEGKSIKDAMFCCGTNVIFRREALMDVGGFDESSVTEDFATSFKFHLKGWHSSYLNKACAFGMGPEDLGGYFKQQFRWCLGTVGLFRKMLLKFLKAPGQLPAAKWLEYFLSGTHYFIGWAFLVMLICPVLYLFFRVPSYFASPKTYFLAYSPYFLLAVLSFLWTLKVRDYRVKDILLGTLLIPVAFPIYIRASLLALLGVKGKFTITPKGGSSALPLVALWPQIGMAVLSLAALVWGADRLYYEGRNVWAVIINGLWCAYNFFALSLVFYFNNPGGPGDA